jgi:CRP/FNR family transcriptional regulator
LLNAKVSYFKRKVKKLMGKSHFPLQNLNRFAKQSCLGCRVAAQCLPGLIVRNNSGRSLDRYSLDNLVERRRIFHQHEHLSFKMQRLNYLYAIHSGSCKAYYVDHEAREHVTNFYYPGDVIGLESIFSHKHLVDIVALETSSICFIELNRFMELHRQSPEIRAQLVNLYSQQLWQAYYMQGPFKAEDLLVRFLLNLSHHAKARGESEEQLHLPMGRHDIGNYLGLSSETISRVITRLKKQKLISVNRSMITLDNLPALHLLVGDVESA